MKEIFDLQWKLNIYTLKNVGVDFLKILEDTGLKMFWIENYRIALSAELAELVREVRQYGIGTENGRVELVDMLHFLVSISQIVEVEPSDVPPIKGEAGGESFDECIIRTFLALDDLQNSLKWKWWAKGGGYKPPLAREAVLQLWICFDRFCGLLGMDFQMVKEIYTAKNRINFMRQDHNYSERVNR